MNRPQPADLMILLLLFFFQTQLTALSSSAAPLFQEKRAVSDLDFVPRDLKSKYYAENWNFMLRLNGNINMIFSFGISDIGGIKERTSNAKIHLVLADGRTYSINREYPYKLIFYEKDRIDFRLHKDRNYWFKGSVDSTISLRLKTEKGGTEYDVLLTLSGILTGVPPKLLFREGGHEFGAGLLIASASVSGYISINNEKIAVTGQAFMDHVWQNFNAASLVKTGLKYSRATQNGVETAGLYVFRKKQGQAVGGNVVTIRDGKLQAWSPTGFEAGRPLTLRKTATDSQFRFFDAGGMEPSSNVIAFDRIMLSYSVLDETTPFLKSVAKSVFGTEIIEFVASDKAGGQAVFGYHSN